MSKVTLHFVWGHLLRKQTVEGVASRDKGNLVLRGSFIYPPCKSMLNRKKKLNEIALVIRPVRLQTTSSSKRTWTWSLSSRPPPSTLKSLSKPWGLANTSWWKLPPASIKMRHCVKLRLPSTIRAWFHQVCPQMRFFSSRFFEVNKKSWICQEGRY